MTSPPLGHYYGPTIQAATVHEDAEMGAVYKRLAKQRTFENFGEWSMQSAKLLPKIRTYPEDAWRRKMILDWAGLL